MASVNPLIINLRNRFAETVFASISTHVRNDDLLSTQVAEAIRQAGDKPDADFLADDIRGLVADRIAGYAQSTEVRDMTLHITPKVD